MDGLTCAHRFTLVQRSFTPTRWSEDTLLSVYERVLRVRSTHEEVSAALGEDVPAPEAAALVLTGGQYA